MKKFLNFLVLILMATEASALEKNLSGDNISIGVSIGGTDIKIGLISKEANLITKPEKINWRVELGQNATGEDIINAVMAKVERLLENTDGIKKVTRIGVAFAGPVDSEKGYVGVPFPAPNLPFSQYALATAINNKFNEILERKHLNGEKDKIKIFIYNDSHAAVLGEFFSRQKKEQEGMIFILGTGTNGAVVTQGKIFTDKKNLCELGFNLVKRREKGWVFLGKETKGRKPSKKRGDQYNIDLFSGEGIAKQFVRSKKSKIIAQNFFKLPPEIPTFDLLFSLVSKTDCRSRSLKAIAVYTVLVGITEAAAAHHPQACQFVKEMGSEFGKSLCALIEHYSDAPWIERIVLVGSVGEKFAKPKGDADQSDLFIQSIRKSVRNHFVSAHFKRLNWRRIQRITKGIERSRTNWKRELIAVNFN